MDTELKNYSYHGASNQLSNKNNRFMRGLLENTARSKMDH